MSEVEPRGRQPASEVEPRERQPRLPADVRHEQVLDAALELITEEGYAAATMEAIARRVGVAKTVVYAAFRRRSPLLEALIERERERALTPLMAPLTSEELTGTDPDHDPLAPLNAWVNRMIMTIASHPRRWRLLLIPPTGTPAAVQAAIRDGREQTRRHVAELLRPVIGKDAPLGELDLELCSHAVVAVCEQLAMEMVADPDHFTPERLSRFACQLLTILST